MKKYRILEFKKGKKFNIVESFYLYSTLNFEIPAALVFQLNRLLTGLTTQQIGTTAQMYSNKTPLTKRNGLTNQFSNFWD